MSDCKVETIETQAVVYAEGDTLPTPTVKLLGGDGGPVNPDDIVSVTMHFDDVKPESLVAPLYTPLSFTVVGTQSNVNAPVYEFPLTTQTAEVRTWRRKVVIVETAGTYTRSIPLARVIDYADLWATPSQVSAIAPGFGHSDYTFAILAAEDAVRAWVSRPISSPVSERVSRAVTLLASRALTAPPAGASIVSETMGDYTVRFASVAPGGLHFTKDIKALLAPWGGGATSTYIGPTDTGVTEYISPIDYLLENAV